MYVSLCVSGHSDIDRGLNHPHTTSLVVVGMVTTLVGLPCLAAQVASLLKPSVRRTLTGRSCMWCHHRPVQLSPPGRPAAGAARRPAGRHELWRSQWPVAACPGSQPQTARHATACEYAMRQLFAWPQPSAGACASVPAWSPHQLNCTPEGNPVWHALTAEIRLNDAQVMQAQMQSCVCMVVTIWQAGFWLTCCASRQAVRMRANWR